MPHPDIMDLGEDDMSSFPDKYESWELEQVDGLKTSAEGDGNLCNTCRLSPKTCPVRPGSDFVDVCQHHTTETPLTRGLKAPDELPVQKNAEERENDEINQPNHYTFRGGIEPMDFIVSNSLDHAEGNIVKYIYRYPHKGGVKDLLKARVYLDKLIERETVGI